MSQERLSQFNSQTIGETNQSIVMENEIIISSPEDRLLALWVDDFEAKCMLPIHNKPGLLSAVFEAKRSGKPLVCLAIACLDWQPAPDGQDPEIDRIISLVFSDNHRAVRVAEGFAQLQRALGSFGINCQTHFTFSDVEAIMTAKLGNMGQRLFNVDLDRDIMISLNSVMQHTKAKGINITSFRHLETLMLALQQTDLRKTQTLLAGKNDPNFHEFLSGLYKFDLKTLPALIAQGNPVVWLNLISMDFLDHIQEIVELSDSSLAIVTPFANAGSWSTKPVSQPQILNKKEFVSGKLEVNPQLTDTSWSKALLGVSDKKMATLLHDLGITLSVEDARSKTEAINIICQLVIGRPLEKERRIMIENDINVIHFLAQELNLNTSAVRRLLKDKGVRLDGAMFDDISFNLTSSTRGVFEIGRKTKLIINE